LIAEERSRPYFSYIAIILFFFFLFIGDEAIISMSVAGEVTDASIMEVGRSRPQFQYSRVSIVLQVFPQNNVPSIAPCNTYYYIYILFISLLFISLFFFFFRKI